MIINYTPPKPQPKTPAKPKPKPKKKTKTYGNRLLINYCEHERNINFSDYLNDQQKGMLMLFLMKHA